jgi:biopolymer transport protein ExbD
MAKRRHASKDEILLVPFLDILCSLIGVLVLIIVVLTVSQVQQTEGRTQEDLDRAQEFKDLKKDQKEKSKEAEKVKELLVRLEELKKQQQEKEERIAKLRKLLASSADVQKQNETMSKALVKELDDLKFEVEGIQKQIVESTAEVTRLAAELKKRQIPPTAKPPAVVVQPSGAGAGAAKLYFIEANGARLTFKVGDKTENVAATEPTIITSGPLNYFLSEVSKHRADSVLVFLMRDNGTGAYNLAGGWAQTKYGIKISRLLLPGQGDIDTHLFGDKEGIVGPMPADFKPPTPAAATPPPTN